MAWQQVRSSDKHNVRKERPVQLVELIFARSLWLISAIVDMKVDENCHYRDYWSP
jgi:hypothetical protein